MYFKYLKIFIVILVSITTPILADSKSSQNTSINALIEEIKKAPSAQKRVKMNQLKILLRTMNQKTRKETMIKLQKSFAKHRQNTHIPSTQKTNMNSHPIQRSQPMRQGQHQGGRR